MNPISSYCAQWSVSLPSSTPKISIVSKEAKRPVAGIGSGPRPYSGPVLVPDQRARIATRSSVPITSSASNFMSGNEAK